MPVCVTTGETAAATGSAVKYPSVKMPMTNDISGRYNAVTWGTPLRTLLRDDDVA